MAIFELRKEPKNIVITICLKINNRMYSVGFASKSAKCLAGQRRRPRTRWWNHRVAAFELFKGMGGIRLFDPVSMAAYTKPSSLRLLQSSDRAPPIAAVI
jgi:hypothetical protein